MSNAYKGLSEIAKNSNLGKEELLKALLSTVFSECCENCYEAVHSEEFLKAFHHLLDELELCKSLSEKNVA